VAQDVRPPAVIVIGDVVGEGPGKLATGASGSNQG
jgi:siroheme synthase